MTCKRLSDQNLSFENANALKSSISFIFASTSSLFVVRANNYNENIHKALHNVCM